MGEDNPEDITKANSINVVEKFIAPLVEKKYKDYGCSWTILRMSSLTDQIFIKAQRIRSIQEKQQQMVDDDINDEFIGIFNYCVFAIIQDRINPDNNLMDWDAADFMDLFANVIHEIFELQHKKNHDYGEAFRQMRISSITDLILQKVHRIKQIEDNDGVVSISEGVEAGYMDIANYAMFCLLKSGYDEINYCNYYTISA